MEEKAGAVPTNSNEIQECSDGAKCLIGATNMNVYALAEGVCFGCFEADTHNIGGGGAVQGYI
jgi:hypothetical protein